MTSNKKRIRLSEIIGPAFYETHKLIDMGVIDEAVEAGGRASLKSSYVGTELVLQLLKHPDCHALVTRQVGDTMRDSVYTTQAQSDIETQNQMADEFRNKLDNVPVTLDTSTCETKISTVSKALDGLKKDIPVTLNFGIKGTLITGIANGLSYSKGGGSSKTKGTGHAAGTPNAPGGKTLVGEIGNELVVNPHTGKWYTVGDNGAEFVNLPHGAIVFDHEKTQRLLKNGFVGGYGDALVSGNAMAAGSPGVDSFVGTAGNNYMPGKNPLVKNTYKATKASTKATKENTKALEENKKALEKKKTALEKQKTALEKESNKLKIYGQAAIDEIEKREKALNKEKEAQDRVFEAQIEALNKKKTALQKANDEEDRAIKLVLPDIVFQITQTRFVVVNKRLRVFCIRKADNIAVFGFMKADKARITATAVTAGKAVTAVLEISCVPFRFCGQVLFICGVSFCASRKRQPAPHRRQSATQPTIQGALLRGQLARGSGCCPVLR